MADSLMIDKTAENAAYTASEGLLDRPTVAKILGTDVRTVGDLTSEGLIRSIRIGRRFMYRMNWVTEFLEAYSGCDLRNRSKMRAAKALKKREDKE